LSWSGERSVGEVGRGVSTAPTLFSRTTHHDSAALAPAYAPALRWVCQKVMATLQDQYDDAMFAFSTGDYDGAIVGLKNILAQEPEHFDAQLALGMAHYRKGDYATAIAEGHKAEKMRPTEQLVHTNLSLFYMKSGDKKTAEHHGLQARIASWKADKSLPGQKPQSESELEMAKPPMPAVKPPEKFPDMPWKKKT
jgi:predicted Zn-dependent protease